MYQSIGGYPWFLFILVNSGVVFSLVQGLWEPRRDHEGAGGAGQGLAALGAAKAAGADASDTTNQDTLW